MTASRARPNSLASLARERRVPRSLRQAHARDLVWFQIDDLNGLFDGLQTRQRRDIAANRLMGARRRLQRILLAVGWSRDIYREHAWAFVEEGLDRPEDAFGPALLLLATRPLPAAAERWVTNLPAPVERTIERVATPGLP